jgi:ethanolamine ammonia-lyase small subunit
MSDELLATSHPERARRGEGPALSNSFSPDQASESSSQPDKFAVPTVSRPETPPGHAPHPLAQLRHFTPARIALGRSGSSLPTKDLLDFSLAHAMARDAVHAELDTPGIISQLNQAGLVSILVHSAAPDRAAYLRRPDLGRRLQTSSRDLLAARQLQSRPDLVFVIADGLSAFAPREYAVPVIQATTSLLPEWRIGPVIVVEQARVAVGDEIGELLQAESVVTLIGERPGLSSPDSLGIYLTYRPRIGRTDAERNCISNVRCEGMSVEGAASTLCYLLTNSFKLKLSGVGLKDDSELSRPILEDRSELSGQK